MKRLAVILTLTFVAATSCKDKTTQDPPPEPATPSAESDTEAPAAAPVQAEEPAAEPGPTGCMGAGEEVCTETKSGNYNEGGVCPDKVIDTCPKEKVVATCETELDIQYYYTSKPMYVSMCEARGGTLSKNETAEE